MIFFFFPKENCLVRTEPHHSIENLISKLFSIQVVSVRDYYTELSLFIKEYPALGLFLVASQRVVDTDV